MVISPPGECTPLQAQGAGSDDATFRIIASCAGFIADAYDLFTIDLVVLLLQLVYGEEVISTEDKSFMVSTMFCGVVIGQLSFGFLADIFGRKASFVTTAALTIVGALMSAMTSSGSTSSWDLPMQLGICRFFLGIGVGGEYPLAATVTAETAAEEPNRRGRNMAFVISMQGVGMLLSCLVACVALSLGASLESTWRILLGFGAVPSCVAFVLRSRMRESEVYTNARDHDGSLRRPLSDIGRHWPALLGTTSAWCLMNLFCYSLGSFKSSILNDVLPSGVSPHQRLWTDVTMATITSVFAMLGFVAGLLLIVRVSRYTMQVFGFVAVSLTFLNVALLSRGADPPKGQVVLIYFGLMFFFLNAGPNITTFVLPAELFPTRVRATCHGISAACGKIGAVVGTAALPILEESYGMALVYSVSACIAFAGAVVTYLFIPRDVEGLDALENAKTT
mmetsp:Transcript_117031/g.331208  ORF Transcript_117031/g.331208 Transcript_117031/m.331208 type:complete len:450 (+) Transcript_117031:65-1414(+)